MRCCESPRRIDIKGIGARCDDAVGRVIYEEAFALAINAAKEGVDASYASKTVAGIRWRAEPPIANAIDEFFGYPFGHNWILVAEMAVTSSEDRDVVSSGNPPPRKLVWAKLHAQFR